MEIFCVVSFVVFEVSLWLVALTRLFAIFARFSNIGPPQVHAYYSSIDYTIIPLLVASRLLCSFWPKRKSTLFSLGITEKMYSIDCTPSRSRLIDYKVADVCALTHAHSFPATVTAPTTMCEADQHKQQQNVNTFGHPLRSKTMERAWLDNDVIINKRKYTRAHTRRIPSTQ